MKNILLLFMIASLVACEKNPDDLPEVSETGSNIFGAKINGEVWGPMKFGVIEGKPILEARFSNGNSVFINARNLGSSPNESEMEIYIKDISGPGTYLLNQNTGVYPGHSASYGYFVKRKITPQNEWITSSQNTGKVVISRYDVTNKIIAGTFEFTAMNLYGTPELLSVTEGRFDMKIQ
jgi:hypothetical protein